MNRLYAAEVRLHQHRRRGRPPAGDQARASSPTSPWPSPRKSGSKGPRSATSPSPEVKWAAAVGKDLKKAGTRGRRWSWSATRQPAYVHAVGIAINQALGSIGPDGTVTLHRADRGRPGRPPRLAGRAGQGHGGRQGRDPAHLDRLGGNPAIHRAGQDLKFDQALLKGPALDPARPARRRDLRACLRLARPRGPFPRVVGRRPGPSTAPRRSSSR